ncbi:MAG: cation:dicarboxylase symporter family transporter [Vicinamibacterales bacterium]
MSAGVVAALNGLVFTALLVVLGVLGRRRVSFNVRVFVALALGVACGAMLQAIGGAGSDATRLTVVGVGVLASAYTRLLEMIVTPLVFVAIASAIVRLSDTGGFGRMAAQVTGVLVGTAAIAALVGILAAAVFGLNASSLQRGENEDRAAQRIETRLQDFQTRPIPQQIVEIIPTNPFYALSGQGPSPTLSVVFVSAFVGIALRGLRRTQAESAARLTKALEALHDLVMRLVRLVLRLAPFGVLALMTRFLLNSNGSEIARLFAFVVASYCAIGVMFGIHLLIVTGLGLSPMAFVRKANAALTFAFTSRSSAATLPLTVQTQVERFGVPEGLAGLAASLGTSVGQNGCAGIYPAMLAVMIAPTVGVDPLAFSFIATLVVVVALGSIGIAGVGGGATFAALTVLSAMGLPVGLVGLLIAIEPLIDMARTALNVSDALVAGLVTARVNGVLDTTIFSNEPAAGADPLEA